MLTALIALAVGAAAAASRTTSGDYGILERFAPRSATTWWAIVESNLKPKTFLVRTTDGGRHWRDVTPPVTLVASSAFLGRDDGWIEAGALVEPRTEPVYRTLDGGRSWQRLARVRSDCRLDFVDERRGWCIWIGAAAGSSGVRLYRTDDGGSSWMLVSRTGLYGTGSTPGALPYRCDKTIAFTSRSVGRAASVCVGGIAPLYTSRDGGASWRPLAPVPNPKKAPPASSGEGVSLPVVSGSELAVAVEINGSPASPRGATVIATSANGGGSWRSHVVPGPMHVWRVDLIDTRRWRLTDGTALLATDDGGVHWRRWKASVNMKDLAGSPLALDFLSPRLGFAVPDGNGGLLWWTEDAGATWKPVKITAGPFTLPRGST